MENMLPLRVEEGRSYKEMWDDANFKVSLQASGLYEAGASACWVPLGPESLKLLKDVLTWDELNELSEKYWGESFRKRLLFPTPLHAYLTKTEVVQAGGIGKLKKSFKLYCGHAVVATWWLELAYALSKGDTSRLELLVQAGLTVTLQVREVESLGEACRWAISAFLSQSLIPFFLWHLNRHVVLNLHFPHKNFH
jgi:hypothetical protein